MTLEKKPFVSYTLDEDKKEESSEVLTIRINKDERALIDELKALMNFNNDAKAIKAGMQIAKNIIHGTFGAVFFRYLTSSTRRKPIQEDQQPLQEKVNL